MSRTRLDRLEGWLQAHPWVVRTAVPQIAFLVSFGAGVVVGAITW